MSSPGLLNKKIIARWSFAKLVFTQNCRSTAAAAVCPLLGSCIAALLNAHLCSLGSHTLYWGSTVCFIPHLNCCHPPMVSKHTFRFQPWSKPPSLTPCCFLSMPWDTHISSLCGLFQWHSQTQSILAFSDSFLSYHWCCHCLASGHVWLLFTNFDLAPKLQNKLQFSLPYRGRAEGKESQKLRGIR